MIFSNTIKLTFALLSLVLFFACTPTPPEEVNEEEVITTLELTFIGTTAPVDTVKLLFKDLDGDGGNEPSKTVEGTFRTNQIYTGNLMLLNETAKPAESINEEVIKEADEHQVFYIQSGGGNIFSTIDYLDKDANKRPLGLKISAKASSNPITSAQLRVVLRHQPDKTASGVVDGNINNAGGETDIDVTFDVALQ